MLGFRSGFGLNMAGVEDLGVGCRFIGEAEVGAEVNVGGGSFLDIMFSASLILASYLVKVRSA